MACLIVQPVIALASSVVFILALVLMDKKDWYRRQLRMYYHTAKTNCRDCMLQRKEKSNTPQTRMNARPMYKKRVTPLPTTGKTFTRHG
jgi:hypothetical protein